jgi:hypothetical protein
LIGPKQKERNDQALLAAAQVDRDAVIAAEIERAE